MRSWFSGPPLLPLRHARLHDPDLDAGHHLRAWPAPAASGPQRAGQQQGQHGDRERRAPCVRPAEPSARLAPQHGGQREDQHGAQRQPIDAEAPPRSASGAADRSAHSRARSRESRSAHGRAAIPSPTAQAPARARGLAPGLPEGGGERRRQPQRTAPRPAGSSVTANGSRTAKGLGLDQERLADPEQAGQEIAEAEPPADLARPLDRRHGGASPLPLRQPMAPSISQTSAGRVTHSTGQAKNGAIASTDSGAGGERRRAPAPAAQALSRALQAPDREFAARMDPVVAGRRQAPRAAPHPSRLDRRPGLQRRRRGRCTRSFFTRRGSASRTSNSSPLGWRISSPRAGTRPTRANTSPPSVSMSSSSSGFSSLMPR